MKVLPLIFALAFTVSSMNAAADMQLHSDSIEAGKPMSKAHEFIGFGCEGNNLSPQLSWENSPKDTKSFAITAYDPDAPTGSGWWHWMVVNIPNHVTQLAAGAGEAGSDALPKGTQTIRNDYGSASFGGACPPKGDKAHRYQFKVFALDVETLKLPENPSPALVGYFLNSHAIEIADLEALYQR